MQVYCKYAANLHGCGTHANAVNDSQICCIQPYIHWKLGAGPVCADLALLLARLAQGQDF